MQGAWWIDDIIERIDSDGATVTLWRIVGPATDLGRLLEVHVERDWSFAAYVFDSTVGIVCRPIGTEYTRAFDERFRTPTLKWVTTVRGKPVQVQTTNVLRQSPPIDPKLVWSERSVNVRFSGSIAGTDLTATIEHPGGRAAFRCVVTGGDDLAAATFEWRPIPTTQPTPAELERRRSATQPSWTEP
jgi:hypothetical protein